jgi:hypothetical protein
LLNHQNEKKIVLLFRSTYNKQFWVKKKEKKAQKRENNKNDNKQPNDVKKRRKNVTKTVMAKGNKFVQ